MESLRPRPGDCEQLFDPRVLAGAQGAYDRIWEKPPMIRAKRHQVQVRVRVARGLEFGLETPAAHGFPGGYRQVADYLRPDPIWICWKYTAVGQPLGMAFDGLVAFEDRWAWFPRPYLVVRHLLSQGP